MAHDNVLMLLVGSIIPSGRGGIALHAIDRRQDAQALSMPIGRPDHAIIGDDHPVHVADGVPLTAMTLAD